MNPTNETSITTTRSVGNHTAYAIIFDAVGNLLRTNTTEFKLTAPPTAPLLIDHDHGGGRDLWEPDYTLLYYSLIFIIIGAASIILVKMRFKRVSYRKT